MSVGKIPPSPNPPKKRRLKMLNKIIGFCLVFVLFLSVSSSALDFRAGDNIFIPKETVIDDNLFVGGDNVTVSGTVKGNLLAFGGNVMINGNIEGTIISGGGDVTISGQAKDMLVAGGNIAVNGIIKRDLLIGGGQVYINEQAKVGNDVFLGCGDADIAGKIYRDLKIGGGDITIAPSALVKGDIDYSAQKIDISKQAKILGAVTSFAAPDYGKEATRMFSGFIAAQKIIGFFAIVLLGILEIVFLHNHVKLLTEKMIGAFWKSLGWGILSLIVIPLAVILLLVTLIGIPLGILLLVAYCFGIYVAVIFTSIVFGKWILGKLGKPDTSLIWGFLLGFIILSLITMVPVVGWIIGFILFLWAFGALVSSEFITYKKAREKEVL
jgi:cytoskeletal protein CcmA (bactofilin family)